MSVADLPPRAAMTSVLREIVEERRRRGIDRWDEVWEGVLHMSPGPAHEHTRVTIEAIAFLQPLVKRKGLGFLSQTNVRKRGSGAANYRVPDLCFVSKARAAILADGWLDGGPDVVFEVHSPGDDTYEKFDFYAEVGVDYIVVIHRDTKRVEVYRRSDEPRMKPVAPGADGWIAVEPLTIALRTVRRPDGAGAIEVRDLADPALRVAI